MSSPTARPAGDARCVPPTPLPLPLPEGAGLALEEDLTLRVLVVAVTASGLLGLAVAHLLSYALAALGLLGVMLAAAAARSWSDPTGLTVRKGASFALVVGVAVMVVLTRSPAVEDLSSNLARALLGLCIAHTLVQDRERDLTVGLLVGALMLVLAAGAAPGGTIAVPLLLGWAAVLGAVIVLHRHHDVRAAHASAPPPRGPRAPKHVGTLVRALVAVGVTGALLLLLVPPPDGASLRGRLAKGAPIDTAAGGGDGRGSRSPATYSGGPLNLRVRGQLPTYAVAYVPASSPDLWRGTVFDTYDGGTWFATPASGTGTMNEVLRDAPIPPPPSEGPVSATQGSAFAVLSTDQFDGVIIAPGRPIRVGGPAPVIDALGGLVLAQTPQANQPGATHPGPLAYTVVADRILDVHELTGGSAVGEGMSASLSELWTTLPPTVPDRVRDLGRRLVTGADSPADAVAAVESYVRGNSRYTLDSPVTPEGQDVVDDFLFGSRLGFCEHFASAEAVLLRAGGIPARVVTGFASSSSDPVVDGQWRALRADHAHAWVEAWVPGVGWISSDPTAGASLAPATTHWWSAVTDALQQAVKTAAGRAQLALGLIVVVLVGWAVAILRRRLVRRPDVTTPAAKVPMDEPDPLPAFRRLEAVLRDAALGRGAHETVHELSRRITTPASDRSAFEVVEEAAYACSPPPAAKAGLASRQLDTLGAQAQALRDS